MCAISGCIVKDEQNKYYDLLKISEIRGQDGTGIHILGDDRWLLSKWPEKASEVRDNFPRLYKNDMIIGQNRLAIFGLDHENDQPLVTNRFALVHNGNLLDFEKVFKALNLKRELEVDTELLLRIIEKFNPKDTDELKFTINAIIKSGLLIKGNFACLLLDRELQCLIAFRKDRPLWYAEDETGIYFFSTDRIGSKLFSKMVVLENKEIKIFGYKNV